MTVTLRAIGATGTSAQAHFYQRRDLIVYISDRIVSRSLSGSLDDAGRSIARMLSLEVDIKAS